ncbi:DinB superfamily protein [Neorhodopirellula lusitana]|uniref:DinB superfamily protein n=1 Tax=Neorhodopirellula lusitana TaxID=445327 RepID=A0ABY1QQC4_9BACT|nr:DinB family protein [Neorhodopirellula lusitana]SMP78029.1 DinB superfamily protein [Neorhodopirellula lusitana]
MNVIPAGDPPTPVLPTSDEAAIMLQSAIGQIEFARAYTLGLLDATPRDRWFERPNGATSQIAWQVGHLAVSQYGLLMFRMRGRHPDDLELIPGRFRKAYARGSKPSDSADGQLTPDELFDKLARVHELAMQEIANVDPVSLLDPLDMPYAAYPCKLGAALFCPLHETLHAGQIGVIRRGLGLDPVR